MMTRLGRREALLLAGIGATVAQGGRRAAAQDGTVRAWPVPCPARPGDIGGLVLEGSGAPAGTVAVFGMTFAPGEVPRSATLAARLERGGPLPVQLDVVTRHADGSGRFGVVALAAPALRAGERAGVILQRSDGAGAPLDAEAALRTRQAVLEVASGGGRSWRCDLLDLARRALADGRGIWQHGALAVQVRVAPLVPAEATGGASSLRLVADVSIHADGVLRVDAWLRNDVAMQRGGGRAAYGMRLDVDGRTLLRADALAHPHYTAWGRSVASGPQGTVVPAPPHLRHDTDRLANLGAVARYDLSTGVATALLQDLAADLARPGWTSPLGARSIAQDMYAAGGRPDIGPATQSQAVWLLTGDPRAAAHAIGQAEAAGSIPWHFWDPEAGGWLDTRRWPLLWTDPRGGAPPTGLLSQVPGDTGWATDCAHQPDLSFVPYLLTGRRAFLDGLQAQAAWSVMSQALWARGRPGARGPGENVNVVRGNQVRGAAWSLRQIGNSAWASPDADPHHAWIAAVENGNWAWIRTRIPSWTAEQGEAHGWIPGVDGGNGDLKPWMQDQFASSAAAAARRGHADALAVLGWMENFLAGRFLAADRGFNPRDGCAYVLAIAPTRVGARPFDRWQRIGAETVARGWSNAEGWGQSAGNFAQYALQSLAALMDVLASERARRAYDWLVAARPPFTAPEHYRRDPTLNIVPRGRPRLRGEATSCRTDARGASRRI